MAVSEGHYRAVLPPTANLAEIERQFWLEVVPARQQQT
jgi:hypothetical protein